MLEGIALDAFANNN